MTAGQAAKRSWVVKATDLRERDDFATAIEPLDRSVDGHMLAVILSRLLRWPEGNRSKGRRV